MAPTPDDRDLMDALVGLYSAVESIKVAESRPLGLTPQQAQLLCTLDSGQCTHGELATLLNCDKTNITGLVNRLERRALVRREPDPQDRRVIRLVLTAEGSALMAQFRDAVRRAMSAPLASWPAGQRGKLVELAKSAAEQLRG